MFRATADRPLATTITGSLPRPAWFTHNLGGRPLSTALHTTLHRRHDDFVDGAFLNWDGTEGMSGGNHEFRELLESLVSATSTSRPTTLAGG